MKPEHFSIVLVICAGVTPAQASRGLRVSMHGCPDWSATEVERLARLELATVGGGESDVGDAKVEVTCDEAGAELQASESGARRSLSRRVELLANTEDAVRVLAISAAQLVRALDWLPEPPTAPPVMKAPVAPAQPARPRRRPLELHLGAGPRTRDVGSPFLTYRAALGSALNIGSGVALGGAFNYERGDAERSLGRVRTELIGAALQANFEPWRGNRWSCLWRAELGLSRVGLSGHDSALGTQAAQIHGFGAEAQLGVGPVWRSASVGVALLAQGGGSYFGGRGLVSHGDAVNLDGAWAGLELAMLWAP